MMFECGECGKKIKKNEKFHSVSNHVEHWNGKEVIVDRADLILVTCSKCMRKKHQVVYVDADDEATRFATMLIIWALQFTYYYDSEKKTNIFYITQKNEFNDLKVEFSHIKYRKGV